MVLGPSKPRGFFFFFFFLSICHYHQTSSFGEHPEGKVGGIIW